MVKSHARPARLDASEEVARLRELLAEAHATLNAIRKGEVDAVVVESKIGPQVYTLDGAEFDYRILIESMNEGALVLTRSAVILYANTHFALMVERPLAQIMGCSLFDLLSATDQVTVGRLLKRQNRCGAATEVLLERSSGALLPARVSIQRFPGKDPKNKSIGMVVSDLTEFRQREDLLRRLSHGLMQLQETERLQIANDLGENIAQLLCSILVRCQLLTDRLPVSESGFRKDADEFVKLLRTTAEEVQRISTDLRPHGLEILGLIPALRGVVAEFAERMGVAIQVNCAKMSARLPAGVELAIYRVLQAALRNVEKHAQARHVTVTLSRRGPVVRLAIKDDGIGFDASDQRAKAVHAGRFGLLSMRERATAVGGSLDVKSRASAGTEVRLNVPLVDDAPRQAREASRRR
jgi:signal transduction histidine kinase